MVKWKEQPAWSPAYNIVYTVLYNVGKQQNEVCFHTFMMSHILKFLAHLFEINGTVVSYVYLAYIFLICISLFCADQGNNKQSYLYATLWAAGSIYNLLCVSDGTICK